MWGKAVEILGKGASYLGGKGLEAGGGLVDKIKSLASGVANPEKRQDLLDKTKNSVEKANNARAGFWGQLGESLLSRQSPNIAAALDIFDLATDAPEAHKGQNLIEGLTGALTLLSHIIPPEYLRIVTDRFANNSVFQWLVEKWPGLDGIDIPILKDIPGVASLIGEGGKIRQKILQEKDPTAVIMALRVMHQDVITGAVTYQTLKNMSGSGILAGGGVAAGIVGLIFGSQITGGPEGASGTAGAATTGAAGLLEKAKEALGIPPSKAGGGPKIMDLVKQNPQLERTKMQKNLISLVRALKVEDSARLVKGSWADNNDYCTISFVYNNGLYYMHFDNDVTSTDIKINNSKGVEILDMTDNFGFSAESDATDIIKAIKQNPSPQIEQVETEKPETVETPANNNNPKPEAEARDNNKNVGPVPSNADNSKEDEEEEDIRPPRKKMDI